MSWLSQWLVWGFGATIVLTIVLAGSQGLRWTRMNIPYLLGTILTPDRDRAKVWGVLLHIVAGWTFALVYVAVFSTWGGATAARGAVVGAVHGAFVLMAGLRIVAGFHPRMASEQHGPTVTRQLEPPGFLALHYGPRTPITVMTAHVLYGAILGGMMRI